MSEMVERVAREMFRRRRRQQGASYFGGQDEIDADWRVVRSIFIDDARAAIEAMREPTEAMESAGSSIWSTMIDAALSDVKA